METCLRKQENSHRIMRLTYEEQQDPKEIIRCFFECYHLKDLRELLWDWLLTALGSDNGNYPRGIDRSNLIFLYENLEKLVEAVYLQHSKGAATTRKKKKQC